MSINFEYYKIFYYVAKYQNISKAAKALQNNQPNITRVMKLLEGELGCQLMVRSNKGVALTEDGERLYGYVQPAVEQLQTAEEELTGRAKLGGGVVTIGASEFIVCGIIGMLLLFALNPVRNVIFKGVE